MDTETEITYKALSLFLVEYQKGDLLGFVLAWISMTPILFGVSVLTLVLIRRDLTTIFYFIGFLLTEVSNIILKNVIKQPRPEINRHRGQQFSKYGMPSDHSQIMFYFASFFILLIASSRYSISNNKLFQMAYKCILIVGSFTLASLVAFSRVYLEYHTVQQVLVGAMLGSFAGTVWFLLVRHIFSRYFYFIASWKISEFLMIRDYTPIPNILLFQYTAERNESNIRRKSNKAKQT
jgi:dolichyldiphosphatase